jgi:hypothetical protein
MERLQDIGGYIITDRDENIIAAAVVELNHERYFEKDPGSNHHVIIIHFHSPFNTELKIFSQIREDLAAHHLLSKHRFIVS